MQYTLPRPIGVQWAWASDGSIVFSPSAFSPNMGGMQRTLGPEGGDRLVRSISWQSSVKSGNHEVLFHLVASPHGFLLGEDGEILLLSVHHIGDGPTMVTRDVTLSGHGILIPQGYVIWVYGEGAGWPHPAPVEVQTMLYLTDVN